MKTSISLSMIKRPSTQNLFSVRPAPEVFLSHVSTEVPMASAPRSIDDCSMRMVKGGSKLTSSWTTHSQIRHSYGMEYGMVAHRVFVSAHVAEDPTVCNRNNGVSVAPDLNDTFYPVPHSVGLQRYNIERYLGW